jgi:hypothetical protein
MENGDEKSNLEKDTIRTLFEDEKEMESFLCAGKLMLTRK